MMFYADDSFFTLTAGQQVGLACLSGMLSVAMLVLVRGLVRGRRVLTRLLVALGLFYLFVWLSPQVYYTYYRFIIDGLPAQIVVQAPPPPAEVIRLLSFRSDASLSFHGQGLLGWAMIFLALVVFRRKPVRTDQ
ncbi:MAG: hypothetical protein JXR14_14130 [Paracoccaceae bacterium]